MHILEERLIDEIEDAKSRIDRKRLDEYVREMFKCLSHETVINASIQDSDNAKRKDQVVNNFQTAWDYGIRSFSEPVDLLLLTEVAGRVEPDLRQLGASYANLRSASAKCFAGYLPPIDESRVKEHLFRALDTVAKSDWHPIEKAVFLNFHLTRIQPFHNGNKRTANIIMNSMLKSSDFFPISISPKQKVRYDGYMQGALQDFERMGASSSDPLQPYKFPGYGQRQFYDFLARTELSELKCAEDKMGSLSNYTIKIPGSTANIMYGAKHKMRDWLKAHNLLHQVRVDVPAREIRVIGDIPLAHLERVFGQMKNIGKYEITVSKINGGSNPPYSRE